MEATARTNSETYSGYTTNNELRERKKSAILERGLKFFEEIKNGHLIANETDSDQIPKYSSSWPVKNCLGKSVTVLTPWVTFVAVSATTVVSAIQTAYYGFPDWVLSVTVVAAAMSLGSGIMAMCVVYAANKSEKKAQELHENELQAAYFKQFTTAFDKYKQQMEEIIKADKDHDEEDNGDNEEKDKLTLKQLVEFLNQCSEKHQNTIFEREMWISELLYLSKMNKKFDIEQGEDEEDPERRLKRLLKKVKKEAKDYENMKGEKKLSKSEIQSNNHFSSETADMFNDNSLNIPLDHIKEFGACWNELELTLGKLSYLAVGNVFVGNDGRIYETEEEAITACKQDSARDSDKQDSIRDFNENK